MAKAKPKTKTIEGLAIEIMLALAAEYFARPDGTVRITDVRPISSGLLPSCWNGWSSLPDAEQIRFSHLLRVRPDALGDDRAFLRGVQAVLDEGSAFCWADRSENDPWLHTWKPVPGKPLLQLADELLNQISKKRREKLPAELVTPIGKSVALRSRRTSFLVPSEHLVPNAGDWPTMAVSGNTSPLAFDRDRLLATAARIDQAGVCGTHHHSRVKAFLGESCQRDGLPLPDVLELPRGRTTLVVAPTGRGKSVLSRVAALDIAARGMTVALILPDVTEVLRQCYELERLSKSMQLGVRVVPVNSVASAISRAEDVLRHPTEDKAFRNWCVDHLAYHCRLSAYADAGTGTASSAPNDGKPSVRPGDEPCFRLQAVAANGERLVSCPFANSCPKFEAYADAATSASILVINHAAFLSGKVPMPLRTKEGIRSKMSVAELVFQRCGLVMIDEIDLFQQQAIGRGTAGLQVSSRPRVSPTHELLIDLERRLASNELQQTNAIQRAQQQLHFVPWLAGLVAGLINRGTVRWPKRQAMLWPAARDGWLTARLFGDSSGAHEAFKGLFEDVALPDPDSERLRQAISAWRRFDQEDELETDSLQASLIEALVKWPRQLSRQKSHAADTLGDIASGIVLRILLSRLELAIGRLRPQLANMEEFGMETAAAIRDGLLGYVPWRAAPAGALGRRVVGFTFKHNGDEPGALHAQVMSGDPHTFVVDLGDEVAMAFSTRRCAVVGFSATARFSGSPTYDVLAPVLLYQPDEKTGVTVDEAVVTDVDDHGKPLSISGISGAPERHGRAERLGFLLWDTYLRDHLARLAANAETRSRARVLLVTGSYAEARVVGRAVTRAIGSAGESRVRIVNRDRSGDIGSQVILPREIESFGFLSADILVAPLKVVCRGHNILQPGGSSASAIASIFVLVRPVPPTDTPARALAHVSYDAARTTVPSSRPGDAVAAMRRRAEHQLKHIQQNAGPFGQLPADLRHHVLCDVLVDLAQLAGRARRGGTDVRVYLVDGAFQGDQVGWRRLVSEAFERWTSDEVLQEMSVMHSAYLSALKKYAAVGG